MIGLGVAPASVAQVPEPPLLPEQGRIAEQLLLAFEAKDSTAYALMLADNLKVFQDGRLVAEDKDDWLKRFGPKLSAPGVTFKLTPGYASTGRILFIEYFNSLASWGRTPPPHCCWGHDAVAYDVSNGKIHVIRRLTGGSFTLDERGKTDD